MLARSMGDDRTSDRERARLWDQLLEIFPGGIVELAADGGFVHANAAALDILGIDAENLMQGFAGDFAPNTIWLDGTPCPVSDYPAVRSLKTGQPSGPITIGLRRPNGLVKWASYTAVPIKNDQGEVTGSIATFLDVTEQVRVDAALRTSEAHLRTILKTAPEVILSTDPDGTVRFINRTVPELSPDAVIGLDVRDFVTPETRPAIEAAIDRCVRTRENVRYEANDPYGRPFEAVVAPVIDHDRVVSLTFVCVDVSESRRLRAQLMVSDRMASVGTLAAGVAHEINNPLTYVLANLQRLQRRFAGTERVGLEGGAQLAGSVEQAIEGAERIRRVVRDLGTFAGRRAETDVSSNVADVVATTLRLATHETRFRADVSVTGDEGIFVRAEPSRLGQALLNLVVNAAQAIPEGNAAENSIRIAWKALDDGQVEITVSDTGVGIPAERGARIFEPFFTTKAPGVGTGLGLYISRNIVTTLKGSIELESDEGQGATFRIVLPAANRHPRQTSSPPVGGAPASVRGGRVLVIDDEALVLSVIVNALSDYDVTGSQSGREAIDLIAEGEFDVIVCDLMMPNVTGMDVYEAVVASRPELGDRFIFMSGGTFTERSRAFRRSENRPFLNKPFEMASLAALVASRLADKPSG